MTALAERAARLFCVGFHGRSPDAELQKLVARGVRSAILFSRNVGAPEEVAALTRALKELTPEPFAIAVDQEGGAVRRLRRGFTELPPARRLGRAADPELARAVGALLGRELRAVGVDWNFAPVLDVDSNPRNPVIGARSFGPDPEFVAALGVALASGLGEQGVAACGKHFPGHGDTELDSHYDLPRLAHDLARLEAVELAPFARAVRAGFPSIMSAHVVFSALDAEHPATLSRAVLRGLLRDRLGYDGLVVSDDLEMQAIVDHFGIDEAAVLGVGAGVDVFLVCHRTDRMHQAVDAVIHGVESGRISPAEFDAAERRASAFFRRWASPADAPRDLAALRSAEHLALAARLAEPADESSPADPTEGR